MVRTVDGSFRGSCKGGCVGARRLSGLAQLMMARLIMRRGKPDVIGMGAASWCRVISWIGGVWAAVKGKPSSVFQANRGRRGMVRR